MTSCHIQNRIKLNADLLLFARIATASHDSTVKIWERDSTGKTRFQCIVKGSLLERVTLLKLWLVTLLIYYMNQHYKFGINFFFLMWFPSDLQGI